jgi:hypothetical protein
MFGEYSPNFLLWAKELALTCLELSSEVGRENDSVIVFRTFLKEAGDKVKSEFFGMHNKGIFKCNSFDICNN